MSAIKKFFEKQKVNRKFKKAGPGHSLADAPSSSSAASFHTPACSPRQVGASKPQTEEQRRAAEAALSRVQRPETASVRTGKAAIRAQVQRELEEERKALKQAQQYSVKAPEVKLDAARVVTSAGGVFFTSDLIPGVMLPKKEMDLRIKQYLIDQLEEDAEMASALLIHTVNKDPEKVRVCMETLCRYIDNLLENPSEDKFRKIRCGNKAFQERVKALEGGSQFLTCAGYQIQRLPFQDGEDDFYVIGEEAALDKDRLNQLKEVLCNAEPIRAELWRAPRLFHCPKSSPPSFGEIPGEFYNITKDELKREQQARQDAVEKLGMLRTKAMRERDEIRELRKYRYTLIRVKFPGDIYLQAIFKTTETLTDLLDFLRNQLAYDWLPFSLLTANGTAITDESKTLAELHLVPACLVLFSYDKTLLEGSPAPSSHVIKTQLLDRLENWSI